MSLLGDDYGAWDWTNYPFLFRSDCPGNVMPKDGCQVLYIRKDFVPTFCRRLYERETPLGLDLALFDHELLNNAEFSFTSSSLAGQKVGVSDSWGRVNTSTGELVEPDLKSLEVRCIVDNPVLVEKRRKRWERLQEQNKRQSWKWRKNPSFVCWKYPFGGEAPPDDVVPTEPPARFPWNLLGRSTARSRSPPPRALLQQTSKHPPSTPRYMKQGDGTKRR